MTLNYTELSAILEALKGLQETKMTFKMSLIIAKNIEILEKEEVNKNIATLVAEPLEKGFGLTLGTALRRILLSSLQGTAVVGVKIDGVLHEFGSIPGVKEDVIELVLNIKQLVLKSEVEHPKKMTLNVSGAQVVTARMIETASDVEIINKDLVLC